jgi:hypothetical protein
MVDTTEFIGLKAPWVMQMEAVSSADPAWLVQSLTGAILGCGGWVLRRRASEAGTVTMLFEFERQACLDVYSVLVAAGVELNRNGHISFTELCQCTYNLARECSAEVATIDLEIQTYPSEIHTVESLSGQRP